MVGSRRKETEDGDERWKRREMVEGGKWYGNR